MYALVALLIISSAVSGSVTPRIVGGHDAEDHKYPYQVLILLNEFPLCGGSIIDRRFILTAAHCIYRENASAMTIVTGTTNLSQIRNRYNVDMLIWNKNYNNTSNSDDIGLIRVRRNITYDIYTQPIMLGSEYNITAGEIAVITGWGRLGAKGISIPTTLQELNTTIINQDACQRIYPQLTKNNICAYSTVNKGVCMGDSGGPLVLRGKQIGIVSYGIPCAVGYPDVYVRVSPYRDWINNVIQTSNAGSREYTNATVILCVLFSVLYCKIISTPAIILNWFNQ